MNYDKSHHHVDSWQPSRCFTYVFMGISFNGSGVVALDIFLSSSLQTTGFSSLRKPTLISVFQFKSNGLNEQFPFWPQNCQRWVFLGWLSVSVVHFVNARKWLGLSVSFFGIYSKHDWSEEFILYLMLWLFEDWGSWLGQKLEFGFTSEYAEIIKRDFFNWHLSTVKLEKIEDRQLVAISVLDDELFLETLIRNGIGCLALASVAWLSWCSSMSSGWTSKICSFFVSCLALFTKYDVFYNENSFHQISLCFNLQSNNLTQLTQYSHSNSILQLLLNEILSLWCTNRPDLT